MQDIRTARTHQPVVSPRRDPGGNAGRQRGARVSARRAGRIPELGATGAALALGAVLVFAGVDPGRAASAAGSGPPAGGFRTDRVLLLPRLDNTGHGLEALHRRNRTQSLRTFRALGGLQVISLPEDADLPRVLRAYRESGLAMWVEPDYLVHAAALPDDPSFRDGTQWALRNTGQGDGLAGADIDAPAGWDRQSSASNIVVAVVDSGIWLTHEDLASNLWVNPGEIPGNGIDDDGNGFVDDVHGLNAVLGNGQVNDIAGHGTHAAGIIGAVGNNARGVAGIAWRVQLMAVRFLASNGSGSVSDAVRGIEYARTMGAHVINASWVGTNYSAALELAVAKARDAGIIFVAAAGNDGRDNDQWPYYPANLELDNVVSVGATTRRDERLRFSNYGAGKVRLMAPGDSIYSTYFIANNNYVSMAGSSTAAPHVAGAAAMVRAAFPQADHREVIDRITRSADPVPALAGLCRSGARLNLAQALDPGPFTVAPRRPRSSRGIAGGPFQLERQSFTLANYAGTPVAWSARATGNWLVVDPTQGDLAPAAGTNVTVSLGPAAYQLAPGRYTNTLEFLDLSGVSASAVVSWELVVDWPATLAITDSTTPGSRFDVGIQGEPGAPYALELTTNWVRWQPMVTNTLPPDGSLPTALTDPGTNSRSFYRARRLP